VRFLLTGGAGFIGSHICEALLERKEDLIVIDHFHRNALKFLPEAKKVTLFRGDVTDHSLMRNLVRSYRPEIIINLAAMAGIESVEAKPLSCIKTNVFGPYYLCELARENDVDKVIHFSTSEVYGPHADKVGEDEVTAVGPANDTRWAYAASKLAADHLLQAYNRQIGLKTIVVRPFNIFGERQTGHGAISHFIAWAIQGKDIRIYGDGKQLRAWCYVKDLVKAVLLLLEKDVTGIFNLGDPRHPLTIKDLASKILDLTGSSSKLHYVPARPVDVNYRVPNIDKAQKVLGWKPEWSFEKALKQTVEWYKTINLGKESWREAIS